MNNYYTLIYLCKHLNFKCKSAEYQFSYSPHKNVWECYLTKGEESFRIIFSASSTETAIFSDNYRAPKKSNVTQFFESLSNYKILTARLADNDRYLYLEFENQKKLIFKLFGNKPNLFLVEDGKIIDSFKDPESFKGLDEPEPRAPKTPAELSDSWSAKKIITKTEPKFPRQLIDPVISEFDLEDKAADEIADITKSLVKTMVSNPEFRVLESGEMCLLPQKVLPLPDRKTFDNCNDAVRFAYYKTSAERRLTARLRSVKPGIEREIKKTQQTIEQLESADKALERAETYEQYGHLLMANAHLRTDGGTDQITVENYYDDGKEITIPLKPNRSISENAQLYYEKSGDAERRVAEAKKRLKGTKEKLRDLKNIQQSLNEVEKIYEFDDWYKENQDELRRLGVLSQQKSESALPFRKTEIDGYEVWIGKNAKSNDAVTTTAHKEDVWLHARGVSGSHVVIRMNNNKEMPPKTVILKAASVAAWNSKARGSSLVPVIVTKRKYVVKPKGLPPGAVRVQREEVEMVKPSSIST